MDAAATVFATLHLRVSLSEADVRASMNRVDGFIPLKLGRPAGTATRWTAHPWAPAPQPHDDDAWTKDFIAVACRAQARGAVDRLSWEERRFA